MRPRRVLTAIAAASLLCIAQGQLLAGIVVTRCEVNQAGTGVNVQAEYTLDPGIDCPPENLRWIQRILLKDPMGNTINTIPGYPNGDFIDPQPNQPPGGWDTEPWYDVTFNSAADRAANTNRQNGAGRFFNDSPNGWGPFGPMSFCATTAIVCINMANCTAVLLGAFTWGFSVAADGTITKMAAMAMTDPATVVTELNGALRNGPDTFSKWTIQQNPSGQYLGFRMIPEPSTLVLALIGVVGVSGWNHRHRHRHPHQRGRAA
jgi:hypothetical protein